MIAESLPHLTPEQVAALVARCDELAAERDAAVARAAGFPAAHIEDTETGELVSLHNDTEPHR